ncbi:U3 small nucleolar RNA-associated protein 18 homolog isoform X2 [Gigantopelta aegis]|uniref:U3 small nucleolar RNA-associated protein 18 homolog isoform X2 n=1 Tax=Gigantopelta aegis TaxID=1735272 RepID=UPI001B88E52C|nr:U3 small nucleolar RNA-associated protein 18 homolog isoform X2 [Gigantopelta aegis]
MLRRSLKRKTEQTKGVIVNKRESQKHKHKKKILGHTEKEDRVEQLLKGIVFGNSEELVDKLGDTSKQKKIKKKIPCLEEERKPAWEDEDDESNILMTGGDRSTVLKHGETTTQKTYINRLEGRFKKVVSIPDWAQLGYKKSNSDDEDSDVEDVLRRTGDYLSNPSSLQNGRIQIKDCTNANTECPTKGKLTSVEFHPTAQVILTAGMDRCLNLFQVDGKTNPKIQGVFFDDFPISTAHFSNSGQEVVLGSWLRTFFCYDMIAGKIINIPQIKGLEGDSMAQFKVSPDGQFLVFLGTYGCIHILSAKSKEWIQTLKMNGNVMSIAFNSDGSKMYSFGDEGCVYVWDMKTLDCVHKFYDDGCFRGTTIAVSPNNQYISCGGKNVFRHLCLTPLSVSFCKLLFDWITRFCVNNNHGLQNCFFLSGGKHGLNML